MCVTRVHCFNGMHALVASRERKLNVNLSKAVHGDTKITPIENRHLGGYTKQNGYAHLEIGVDDRYLSGGRLSGESRSGNYRSGSLLSGRCTAMSRVSLLMKESAERSGRDVRFKFQYSSLVRRLLKVIWRDTRHLLSPLRSQTREAVHSDPPTPPAAGSIIFCGQQAISHTQQAPRLFSSHMKSPISSLAPHVQCAD